VLDRLEEVADGAPGDALFLEKQPFDIIAREGVALDRVRAPRVEGARPPPDGLGKGVEGGSREELGPQAFEYVLAHDAGIKT
jgi:hypothetical protein